MPSIDDIAAEYVERAAALDPGEQVARAAMAERLALAVECYDAGDTTSEMGLDPLREALARVQGRDVP